MQFITTDQRIAVENFEIGLIYTVTFTSGSFFLGACIGKGANFVMFQRTAPELIFSLTMAAAADVASIDPLGSDIGKILEYTGSVPVSIKTNGSPLLAYTIKGNELPGTGDKTANLSPPDWADDFVQRINNTALVYTNSNILNINAGAGYGEYDTKYIFKTDWKEDTQYTFNLEYRRDSIYTDSPMLQITYTDGTITQFPRTLNDGEWHNIYISSEVGKTVKYLNVWYSSAWLEIKINNFFVYEGTVEKPFEPFGVKIPILSGDTTTNIYLDNPLRKSLDGTAVDELSSNGKLTQRVDTDGSVLSSPIISYIDTPIIPTTDGLNIFDISTTVKPSEIYIKYFSPLL